MEDGVIVNAAGPSITAQCLRVPASNGHMAAVFARFRNKPSLDEIKAAWAASRAVPRSWPCPLPPKQFLHYFEEPDRPQTRLDRMTEGGMAVCIGRLRPDTQYDYKFVCLSHNTLPRAPAVRFSLLSFSARRVYPKEVNPILCEMPVFTGACTAIVTPFDQSGAIDYGCFGRLIDQQLDTAWMPSASAEPPARAPPSLSGSTSPPWPSASSGLTTG